MEYGALREPVVQEITALAIHQAATTGKLNSFYSPYDLARLKWEISGALIPFFSIIRESWSVVTRILVVIAIFKIILGMILRAVATYRQRGCGWWLLASLFHTAFLTLAPWKGAWANVRHGNPGGTRTPRTAQPSVGKSVGYSYAQH